MTQRKAQSTERAGGMDNGLNRLTDVLTQLLASQNRQSVAREAFEAPEFDGTSDVECFIRQFSDVSQANRWTDVGGLLHIRAKLKKGARDCGHGDSIDSVFAALRARYGMSRRQARTRLSSPYTFMPQR